MWFTKIQEMLQPQPPPCHAMITMLSLQVVNPHMRAHLYTWGAGHVTAEGERIPVKVKHLSVYTSACRKLQTAARSPCARATPRRTIFQCMPT